MISPDSIGALLERLGHSVDVSWLFDRSELGIVNGTRVIFGKSEIVYRQISEDTILIVLYRKEKHNRKSLSFSLAGLFCFFRFVAEEFPNIRYATGLVDVHPYIDDDGISTQRLMELYSRCGAEITSVNGRFWAEIEVRNSTRGRKTSQSTLRVMGC